jgi:hypothetical protein
MALHIHDGEIDNLAEDADVLTMGITPSGDGNLHAGHYTTLLNLCGALSRKKTSRGRIFIDDREFQNQRPPCIPSRDATLNVEEAIRLFLQHAVSFFHDESLPLKVDVQRLSDFFREQGKESAFLGMDLLQLIRRYSETIRSIFHDAPYLYKMPVKPVCPSCDHGPRQIKHAFVTDRGFRGECDYEECDGLEDTYEVDVARGDTYWSIYYMLLGLRDVLLSDGGRGVLHIYGGDYGVPWNQVTSKAARISALLTAISGNHHGTHVDQYVGPLLMGRGHRKLSKSRGDRLSIVDCALLQGVLDCRERVVNWNQGTL